MELQQLWQQWQLIAASGIMLAAGFSALVYMLGRLLANDKMSAFGRAEAIETVYSAVLVVSVMMILSLATTAAEDLIVSVHPHGNEICKSGIYDNYFGKDTLKQFPCHMRVARIYLDTLYAEGRVFNYELLSTHIWYMVLQGIGLNSDFHEHASGTMDYSPMGSLFSLPSSIYSYMFEFGMKAMVLVRFQAFFLNFITFSLYPVLLVLGLLLRTFPFSRRLGGLLMAIAISLFFVFPMFYVFGGIIFENIRAESPTGTVLTSLHFDPAKFYAQMGIMSEDNFILSQPSQTTDPSSGMPGLYSPVATTENLEYLYKGMDTYCDSSSMEALDTLESFYSLGQAMLTNLVFAVDFTDMVLSDDYVDSLIGPGGVIDSTARFVFFSMFFAILSVFSTVGAIKSLSPLLGGDVELAGLTHLI